MVGLAGYDNRGKRVCVDRDLEILSHSSDGYVRQCPPCVQRTSGVTAESGPVAQGHSGGGGWWEQHLESV